MVSTVEEYGRTATMDGIIHEHRAGNTRTLEGFKCLPRGAPMTEGSIHNGGVAVMHYCGSTVGVTIDEVDRNGSDCDETIAETLS